MKQEPGTRLLFDEESEDQPLNFRDDTPELTKQPRSRAFLYAVISGILLLLLTAGAGTLWYFYSRSPSVPSLFEGGTDPDAALRTADEARIRSSYYTPAGAYSKELLRIIELYKSQDRERAKREFENFVNSPAEDKEKAVALVYLGIMAMETERYPLAKHNLLRALRYDSESVAAYANLAIAERMLGNIKEAREYALRARELSPSDPVVSLLLGNLLAENQDIEGAISAYREGILTGEEDPALYYNLALTLVRSEKYEEAVREFSRAIAAAPTGPLAAASHAHLGQIYFSKGNAEMAADHLNRAVALAPDNGKYYYNLGVIYSRLNRNQEAVRSFHKAMETGKADGPLFHALAKAFTSLKQPNLAVAALRRAVYMNPEDYNAYMMLGDLYHKEKDLIQAAASYKKAAELTPGDSVNRDSLLKLGSVYMDMERFGDAASAYRKVLDTYPENPEALFGLGYAYRKSGMTDKAVAVWKSALSASAADRDGFQLDRKDERMIRMAAASLYRSEGAYDLALREYNFIISRNKEEPVIEKDAELYSEIAAVYQSLREYGKSAVYLEKVLDWTSDPELRFRTYKSLALAYQETGATRDNEKARTYAAQAQSIKPSDQDTAVIRAGILLKTSSLTDREKAIELLKAVTASDTDPVTASKAYNLLGLAYYQNGEYARALRAFDYSVQLDPSNSKAYENQRIAAAAHERSLTR